MQSGTYDFLWYDIGNNIYATQNKDGGVSGTQKRVHPPGITSSEITVDLTITGSIPTLSPTPPTYTSTPCLPSGGFPGDGNNDGLVDVRDFVIWLYHFGQSVPGANDGILIMTDINDDYINWAGNC